MSAGTMSSPAPVPSPGPKTHAPELAPPSARWYFYFFFFSGLCSILYELIWLRLAMAEFGVTTAMVSIVLSTFMAGLGVGSWVTGRLLRSYGARWAARPLQLYAATEILIGGSALLVPLELKAGRFVLEHLSGSLSLSSSAYYVAAAVWLAATLIPWCACMGATIPLGMFAIRRQEQLRPQSAAPTPASANRFSRQSFSFLYLANVLGAVAGTIFPLALIELWGFTRTLQIGMMLNVAICLGALELARRLPPARGPEAADQGGSAQALDTPSSGFGPLSRSGNLGLLFATGLTSMGMEVVWTRLYTFYIGTLVYSFAVILAVYLAATFLGSKIYRRSTPRHSAESPVLWLCVWLFALAALLTADLRVSIPVVLRVPLGIAGFSGLLGFLTPMLVDRYSGGDPNRAGTAYAVNVAGCILGPLIAGFGLLPYFDERYALAILALPWLVVGVFLGLRQLRSKATFTLRRALAGSGGLGLVLTVSLVVIFRTQSYVYRIRGAEIRRDSTATVVAAGQGMDKQLFVNGVAMTLLTPITKIMASMPLASLDHPPQKALTICFGMGTTHRSLLSWGIDSTAVDLVPSVPELFWYYHADAPLLLGSPHSHVVIDDGRRFLERTSAQYDVIVVDPPPPIDAAGSSLLYSREFYWAAQKRLRPGGILMQWYPGGDTATTSAISRSLKDSFGYVRAFGSSAGWGTHYMASQRAIPNRSASELADRMPPNARRDLIEWGPFLTAEQQFAAVLKNEVAIEVLMAQDKNAPALEDDRPVNEYGLLRHLEWGRR